MDRRQVLKLVMIGGSCYRCGDAKQVGEARGERGDSAGTRRSFGTRNNESWHKYKHHDGWSNHDGGRNQHDACSNHNEQRFSHNARFNPTADLCRH